MTIEARRATTVEGIPHEYLDYAISANRQEDRLNIRGINVYAPRAFKATTMLVGSNESSVALATGWIDPWNVVAAGDLKNFSIVAPLRTPMGINIVLWNLAKNPQIRHLGVWASDELDRTSRGSAGREYLESLWNNGIEEDGTIRGTAFKLLPELVEDGGIEIIRQIIEKVRLHDFSNQEKSALGQIARGLQEEGSYMTPYSFKEFEIRAPDSFPSEEAGLEIREKHLFDAWLRLVDRIMRYGKMRELETGGALVREIEFARVVIEGEDLENFHLPDYIEGIGELRITRDSLDSYFREKILPDSRLVEIYPGVYRFERGESRYLYSELMFFYPRDKGIDQAVHWIYKNNGLEAAYEYLSNNHTVSEERINTAREVMNNTGIEAEQKVGILLEIFIPPVNQVEKAIERIKTTPADADKTFILWDPATHGVQDRGRPCLVYASLLVRDGRVDMQTTWRSHDIAKGWPDNLYGMLRLQEYIAKETGNKRGYLLATSESAHIYQADVSWMEKIWREHLVDKKLKKVFHDESEADPRGNVNITVVGNEIVLVLQDPETASPLTTFRGTFKDVYYMLKKLDLLSNHSHLMDVGSELQKAEMCRLLGIPYVQDKPIDFRNLRQGG